MFKDLTNNFKIQILSYLSKKHHFFYFMNNTLKKIKESRSDLSEYLYHFTKGSSALDTINKIILDGKLIDINNTGVIWFNEAPVYQMLEMWIFRHKVSH